jgi:hypothetical protein
MSGLIKSISSLLDKAVAVPSPPAQQWRKSCFACQSKKQSKLSES